MTSESLADLIADLGLPGTCWLVDLPGDGSNTTPLGAPTNPYALWPRVFLEAVDAVSNPVAVGHSTGGEYLLSGREDRIVTQDLWDDYYYQGPNIAHTIIDGAVLTYLT